MERRFRIHERGKAAGQVRPKFWNRLYRNNGDGTFTDVTEKAGVKGHSYGMGVAVADYDNDGRPDIYVTNYGANILYHNNGDGTFSDVTARAALRPQAGLPAPAGWTTIATDTSIWSCPATCNGISAAIPGVATAPPVTEPSAIPMFLRPWPTPSSTIMATALSLT